MDHGSCESQAALALLKTAKGQIDAVIRMIEDDRYCIDVSKQILASAALLKKANTTILRQHMNTCVLEAVRSGTESGANSEAGAEKLDEIMRVIESYIN